MITCISLIYFYFQTNNMNSSISENFEKETKLETLNYKWICITIEKCDDSNVTVILCPGFPESTPINKEIMDYLHNEHKVNCVYPQYLWTRQSEWKFLEKSPADDITNTIELIRSWKTSIPSNSKIVLLWSSFWWWVALSQSWNNNVAMVIALSPLTWESDQVNRSSLLDYMKWNRANDYRIDEAWYEKLVNKKLLPIPKKYPEWKVIIWGLEEDPEINYNRLKKESLKKHAKILDDINVEENEKKHLSWNVINRMTEEWKEKIFHELEQMNIKDRLISEFTNCVLENIDKERVCSILWHWSWLFKNASMNWDVDFILVLDTPKPEDMHLLRELKQHFKNLGTKDLDITLVYKDNIEKWGIERQNYSTHGSYYNIILANAECFYWKNIFKEHVEDNTEYSQWFLSEVWKYTDRLNRSVNITNNMWYYKKYLKRIILSIWIYKWIITPYKSNYFNEIEMNKVLRFAVKDENLINIINDVLKKEEWNEEDWWNIFYAYNKLNNIVQEKTINLKNNHISSILSTICQINDNVVVTPWNKEELINNPSVKFISCANFKSWAFDQLEDADKLNAGQINNLAQINIIVQQIQSYFNKNHWSSLPITTYFWDYWVRVNNPELLEKQFESNKKYCTKIFNGEADFKHLKDSFPEYKYPEKLTLEWVKTHLLSLWLSEEFVDGYLFKYKDKDPKELDMILWSIYEHANLIDNMIKSRKNTFIIYVWNSQKIVLMNEIIKSREHSNIFIWIKK